MTALTTAAGLLVTCDVGEGRSGIPALLARRGVDVDVRRLDVGDYLLSSRMAVERKGNDLVDSLRDGRLRGQLERLADSYERPVLLLEGDAWLGDRRLRLPLLARLYHWIGTHDRLALVYSPSEKLTAKLLIELARIEASGAATAPPQRKPGHRRRGSTDLLLSLPGVGPANATRLAELYTDFPALVGASASELRGAIGDNRGQKLYELLHEPIR